MLFGDLPTQILQLPQLQQLLVFTHPTDPYQIRSLSSNRITGSITSEILSSQLTYL